MPRSFRILRAVCVPLVLVMLVAVSVGAQVPAAGSASEFYLRYRKAFDAAKKVEDIVPFMSASTKKEIESTPAAERGQMFEMIKMMGAISSVKIVKETRTPTGATLNVEALDPDKTKTFGTIDVSKEGTAWKIAKESWSNK